jgi:hypothetical protein
MISVILIIPYAILYLIIGFAILVIATNLNADLKETLHKEGIVMPLILWPLLLFIWVLIGFSTGINLLFKKFTSR